MIFDTHAHLNMDIFQSDLEDVILRSRKMGVSHILVIGMDPLANNKAIEIANQYEHVYASVGIHPSAVNLDSIADLKQLLSCKKVVAIGECGLDYYWTDDNKELQKSVFQYHIELAVETKMPLIIHSRSSFIDIYQMLLPYRGQISGVFHCFSSDLEDAKKAIDLGFYIGIDGPITYKNNQQIKEIVEQIDLSHMLVETDSPYLTPVPYRGKRNEPGYTKFIVDQIAKIKQVDAKLVANITTQNAIKLFNIKGEDL